MILAAVHQVITYKQFLPVVLGRKHMKRFGLNLLNKVRASRFGEYASVLQIFESFYEPARNLACSCL